MNYKINEYLHLIKEISFSMPAMERLKHNKSEGLEFQIIAAKF